jgi:hypothetical protein
VNIKSVGVPSAADQVVFAQGSPEARRFVAVYGKDGRVVAAVTFNHGRWIEFYLRLIERSARFPLDASIADAPSARAPMPAAFPDRTSVTFEATAILTGYDANDRRVHWIPPSPPPPPGRAEARP